MIIAIILLSLAVIILGIKCFRHWVGNCIVLTYIQQKGYNLPTDTEIEIAKAFVVKNIINDLTNRKI